MQHEHSGFLSMVLPFRTNYYQAYAEYFFRKGILHTAYLGTRNGFTNVPTPKHRLRTYLGLLRYSSFRLLPTRWAESVTFHSFKCLDRWAAARLSEEEHVFASYGHANKCFRLAHANGNHTFLDAGNSHPKQFNDVLSEESKIWGVKQAIRPQFHYERSLETVELTDYVLSPSHYVRNSFIDNGFDPERIINTFYPVDLDAFRPNTSPYSTNNPLTIVCTGRCSIRKGTPYLLEAFSKIKRSIPDVQLILCGSKSAEMDDIFEKYRHLDIRFFEPTNATGLSRILNGAHIFVLPSLEEGLVRTALEAMSCNLPVILTPHTGANDYVTENENGSVISLRSPDAIVDRIQFWWNRLQSGHQINNSSVRQQLSYQNFEVHMDEHFFRRFASVSS